MHGSGTSTNILHSPSRRLWGKNMLRTMEKVWVMPDLYVRTAIASRTSSQSWTNKLGGSCFLWTTQWRRSCIMNRSC